MPPLPGNVARYDSVELLDLDQVNMQFGAPGNATLKSWQSLAEAERRWAIFDWATFVVPDRNRNRTLLRDFATAYLFSFEATLQVLLREKAFTDFDAWLRGHGCYDILVRGLRTLRHLQAHIQPTSLGAALEPTYSRFAHMASGGTVGWCWAPLTLAELDSVRAKNSKLETSELPAWNALCVQQPILGQMRQGLVCLHKLLLSAGP